MINIFFVTLGCSKNTVDTEKIKGALRNAGYEFVSAEKSADADLIIINTCGFIKDAKEESINTIFSFFPYKKNNTKIIVTGCLAQRYSRELEKEIPELDGIVGLDLIISFPNIVKKVLKGKKINCVKKRDKLGRDFFSTRILETPRHYAYLKISDGCSNNCSYCAIPLIRGDYRSRNIDDILSEVKYLSKKGVKEIILISQDSSFYGVDIHSKFMLASLLKKIAAVPAIKWVRVLYCYPTHITDELIKVISNEEKVVNYVDIPLQHTSDEVLRYMGRKYNIEQVKEIISKLRSEMPEIALRTTFMLGFPGENEISFQNLISFLQEIKFDWAGFFMYSKEERTYAYNLHSQLSDETVRERYKIASEVQEKITQEINYKYIGEEFEVVIDGKSECFPNFYESRPYRSAPEIDGLVLINTKEKELQVGSWKNVIITGMQGVDLLGEVK